MSIWSSWEDVGYDDMMWGGKRKRGEVRSYAILWSNHYPTTDGKVEQPASVGICHIPQWCVPGHRDEPEEYDSVAPWVRLTVVTSGHDHANPPDPLPRPEGHSVVMDEKAARALVKDLNAWLKLRKVHPK